METRQVLITYDDGVDAAVKNNGCLTTGECDIMTALYIEGFVDSCFENGLRPLINVQGYQKGFVISALVNKLWELSLRARGEEIEFEGEDGEKHYFPKRKNEDGELGDMDQDLFGEGIVPLEDLPLVVIEPEPELSFVRVDFQGGEDAFRQDDL